MSVFLRGLLVFTLFTLIVGSVTVAAAVRLFRPPYSEDLSGRIAFLLGDNNCLNPRCPFQIGVVHGQSYRPMPLPVEPLAFAWSPDGSHLAFVGRDRDQADLNPYLYIAQTDGSHPTPITPINFLDRLSWSPDGRFLAFSYTNEGDSGIYTIPINGAQPARLTTDFVSMSPQWSPDGSLILFQVRGYDGQQIYVADPVNGGMNNLTGDSTYDYAPQWSPDGERILFLSRDRARTFSTTGVPLTQAFIMDRDGRNLHQITRIYGNVFGVRWSPQGDMLAFYVAEARTDLPIWGNLYVLDIAHGITVQITRSGQTNSIGDFEWSPDGTRLAYVLSPLEYSRICIQGLGGRAQCVAGDRVRKSDIHWLTGDPLPAFPVPSATPISEVEGTQMPGGLRLE